jgi:acyl dehydratase
VLDKSQHGWWRLAVLAIVAAIAISGVAIVFKMEKVQFPQPVQHDSACRLKGDSIICE